MAVEFDANVGGLKDLAVNHTLANNCSGINRFAVAFIVFDGFISGLSMTYGGELMAQIDDNTGIDWDIYCWGILAPKEGAQNVIASWTTSRRSNFNVSSYVGVDQDLPYGPGTVKKEVGTSTNSSVSLTSIPGEMCISGVSYRTTTGESITVGTGQTTLRNNFERPAIGASYKAGATTVQMYYDFSVAREHGQIGLPMRAFPPGQARGIEYFYDIYSDDILDAQGRKIPPWEIKANRWIKVTGVFLPSPIEYESFVQDPTLAYIEEVSYNVRGGLKIKTSRGELTDVLLARAAGGKTL